MGSDDHKNSESQPKRRSDSVDSPAEKRVYRERIALEALIDDRKLLASASVNALSWDLVVGMLPEYLKTRSKKEVISLVSDELEGMSKRRINAILEGDDIATSSSSESESSSNRANDDSDIYSDDDDDRRNRDSSYDSRSPSPSSRSLSRSETDEEEEIVIYD